MQFNRQFLEKATPYISENSGVKHKLFVDEAPLTVTEMYRRAVNGIPLSVPRPKEDRIPLNNCFYTDDFDVLDVSIMNDKKLSEERRKQLLEDNEKRKAERLEFDKWKKEQELARMNKDDVKDS